MHNKFTLFSCVIFHSNICQPLFTKEKGCEANKSKSWFNLYIQSFPYLQLVMHESPPFHFRKRSEVFKPSDVKITWWWVKSKHIHLLFLFIVVAEVITEIQVTQTTNYIIVKKCRKKLIKFVIHATFCSVRWKICLFFVLI